MRSASAKNRDTARTVIAAAFLLAGVFGLLGLARADEKDEKEPKKKPAKVKPITPTGPMTLKRAFIKDIGADVKEMSKLIDAKLAEGWKANKITPSHYIDDHAFIRRASLDIIGRVATPKEIQTYMAQSPETRRSWLIEDLLKRPEYPRHWAHLWANWLLTRSGDFGRGVYKDELVLWLEDQFAKNKPYNEIVTKLLTATGKNVNDDKNPARFNAASNFILAHVGESVPGPRQREEGQFEMVPLTSRIARVFMGTQIQCAQCHPHPFFNGMKQEMFWGINAFLRQVKMDGRPMRGNNRMGPPPTLVLGDNTEANTDGRVYFELRSGKFRWWQAEFLPPAGKERGPRLDSKKKGVERREELAKFLVEHEMFSKAMVNRMWGLFFGRGFVNPIDDFNDNNQPSNPELLDELSVRFKHYNFDFQKLIRWIAHSDAYHRSYVANPSNDRPEHEPLFSRMVMKALTPEQLFESLATATKATGADANARKAMRDRWLGSLVTNFGDDEGNEVTFNGTIVQALMMMNGKDINDAISRDGGMVAECMKTGKTQNGIITQLYLAALNRHPRKVELDRLRKKILLTDPRVKDSPRAMYEDLYWALLNSNEFLLNH